MPGTWLSIEVSSNVIVRIDYKIKALKSELLRLVHPSKNLSTADVVKSDKLKEEIRNCLSFAARLKGVSTDISVNLLSPTSAGLIQDTDSRGIIPNVYKLCEFNWICLFHVDQRFSILTQVIAYHANDKYYSGTKNREFVYHIMEQIRSSP